MLSKKNILEVVEQIINEGVQEVDSYGHWIAPDGKPVYVNYAHEITAIEIIKNLLQTKNISVEDYKKLNIPLNSTSEVEGFLYDRGWIRGVREYENGGKKAYWVNGKRNQRLTPKQTQWLINHGIETERMVKYFTRGEQEFKGMKVIYSPDDIMEKVLKESIVIQPANEKAAKFFIYSVWRIMPAADKFSPYQFSLWMDNETHLHKMKERMANELYPNDDDAGEKFFNNDVTATLEKLEQAKYERKAKKVDVNDPLFVLKSVVKGKTFEGAKQAMYRTHLFGWWYKGGKISDEDANKAFERLYRHAMGETSYDKNVTDKLPYLSDMRQPSPTGSKTEEIFIQQYAGWKAEKFPDKVRVWRGTNSPHNKIKAGDFVTFDRDYADSYARGKFKAIVQAILPSSELKVYRPGVDDTEMIYWPKDHAIKKFEGNVPTFQQFWAEFR